MRIAFLGNGPFATPILRRLMGADHTLALVVARPDRPRGKHRRIEPGPVTCCAGEAGMPVYQPDDVNAPESRGRLRAATPDILVVADFGQILDADCLATARLGGINAHASLLPAYRGAAPVAWAILRGESETGVSIIRMNSRMDAGGVLSRRALPIGPNQTAGAVEAVLAQVAAELVVEALSALEAGTETVHQQDPTQATRAPKLTKQDGLIRWARLAREVHDQVRAMQPWPMAFSHWLHESDPPLRITFLKTEPAPADAAAVEVAAGTVAMVDPERLSIATGSGLLAVHELQPAGKRPMSVANFLRGRRVEIGDRFR